MTKNERIEMLELRIRHLEDKVKKLTGLVIKEKPSASPFPTWGGIPSETNPLAGTTSVQPAGRGLFLAWADIIGHARK